MTEKTYDLTATHDELDKAHPTGHHEWTIEMWESGPCDNPDYNGYWDWVRAIEESGNSAEPADASDQAPASKEVETINVESLDTFVKLLVSWHGRKVKVLEHYLQLQGGIEMQVADEPPFILEGDILKGLKAGVNLALMELGTLPFGYQTEEAAPTPAAPTDAVQS